MILEFEIVSDRPVSNAFRERELYFFSQAAHFVEKLPYRRIRNQEDPLAVLHESCGTCSSKHRLLKMLCDEQNKNQVKLILALFHLRIAKNPKLQKHLQGSGLDVLPELHSYLKVNEFKLDLTGKLPLQFDYPPEIEFDVEAENLSRMKSKLHKSLIEKFLEQHPESLIGPEELWKRREDFIRDLSY